MTGRRRLASLAVVLVFLVIAPAPAELKFLPQELPVKLGVGYAVNLVDMNADGRTDILVVDSKRVIWLENPKWTEHTIMATPERADNVCIATHDIDGDGRLDAALGADWNPANTKSGGTIGWLSPGKKTGDLWDVVPIGEEPTVHRMRWVDLDHDGRPELVVAPLSGRNTTRPNFAEAGVRLLAYKIPSDPRRGPWTPEVINDELHVTHNFWPTDLDRDGRVDLLVVSFEGVSLLRRSADGKWSRTLLGDGNQETRPNRGASEIKHGKLSGDRDYVATIEPWHGHQVVVYIPPAGKPAEVATKKWTRHVIDQNLQWGHAVWCANLDADDDQELIIGVRDDKNREHPRGLRIYDPAGDDPKNWKPHRIDPGGVAIEDVAAADLDADGKTDIVAVGRQTHNVRVYWNKSGTAKEAEPPAKPASFEEVGAAITRGLKIVERGAENYPKHRQCFSCHHQTLPMLAIREARAANLDGNRAVLKSQAAFTLASFKSRTDDLRKGEQIGGRAVTVGYGLWALREAEHPADETTDAMVEYLLKTQDPSGCWIPQTERPPLEISRIAATAIAVFGLQQFRRGIDSGGKVEQALDKAERWLAAAPRRDHEDLVFARWGEKLFDDDDSRSALSGNTDRKESLTAEIRSSQRPDGGWAQKADMQSDAYATGQALWLLRQLGDSASQPSLQRAVAFLINTQKADGSWLVETRSKPIQKFFDNGDPHGNSQFISIAATGWAVAALAATLVDSNTDRYLGNPTVRFVKRDGRLEIAVGGRHVGSYIYRDPKIKRPYFANLKAKDSDVSRRHPPTASEATDHDAMHPGLWLAFGDLSGEDFWRNRGRVVHEKFIAEPTSGNDIAWLGVQNRYESEDGKRTIARETCRWTIDARKGLLYLCDSTFTPVDDDFYFGDQEEMGLGIRLTSPLTVKNGGSIRDSEGRSGESKVWGKSAKWCDYQGVIDGLHVGALVMPDPKNFRPSWFHARDYGLLVANPFGQNAFTKGEKSKVRVAKGESLRLRFGVLLHTAGAADAFKPDQAYDDFLKHLGELAP